MENSKKAFLSEADKILVKQIDSFYEIGSQLFGNEPFIYRFLGVEPPVDELPERGKLADARKKAFGSGVSAKKSSGNL
jgi:hypothetical protein